MKKTTVMFRMLDYDWTALNPHRADYAPYRGSNLEEENFNGGKSIVFAMPTSCLEKKIHDVDIQIHVRKEISKYFEMDSCQNVGLSLVNVDNLFNGIIKELQERKELEEHLSCFHKREPISRSLKGTYEIMDEDRHITGATITLYVRLSYFGKSVITEIETAGCGARGRFYAQEETNEGHPYQLKELKRSKLESGCWGSDTLLPPVRSDRLTCHCDNWEPLDDHGDEKTDDSDNEIDVVPDNFERQNVARSFAETSDKNGKSHEDRDNESGNGKKDKKGKKSVKDSGGHRGSIEKTKSIGGKRGKKLKTDEKDGSQGKKSEVTGSSSFTETSDKNGKSHEDRDNESGNGKKDKKGKKSVKDSGGLRGSIEKTKAIGGKRGKKLKTDEKDGSQGKKSEFTGSSRKARNASGNADIKAKLAEKIEKGRSEHRKMIEKPAGPSDKENMIKEDLKDQRTIENARGEIAKAAIADVAKLTRENTNRRIQLRRRHRGIVTVGFQDKKKKICLETLEMSPASPTNLPQMPAAIQPTICSNIHSLPQYSYPSNTDCKPTMFLPLHCSMDTRNERSYSLFSRPGVMIIPEMPILTN